MSLKQYIAEKITRQKDLKMLEQYEKTYSSIAEQTKQLESDLFNFMRVKYPKLTEWLEQYIADYKKFAEAVHIDKLIFRSITSTRTLNGFDFIDKQLEIINNVDNNKVAEILTPEMYTIAKKEKAGEALHSYLKSKDSKIYNDYCENKRTILRLGPTLNMENRPELFELYHTAKGLDALLQHKMKKCKLAYDEYSRSYNDYVSKHCLSTKGNNKPKHKITPYNDKWTTSQEQVLLQQIANLDPQAISMEAKEKVELLAGCSTM